jgi:hypothetical protein
VRSKLSTVRSKLSTVRSKLSTVRWRLSTARSLPSAMVSSTHSTEKSIF